jgi:hypothetical protein
MDIESLKEALGDEKFKALKTYVDDLTWQRDTARSESITGRKKLKDDLAAAQSLATKALEKLGIDNAEELDALPDAKGQVDALKQFDTKLKRAERERDDAKKLAEDASGKYRGSLQRAAVAEALGGHEFVARDIVESFIGQRLMWEGDDLLFKTDDGKLVPVKDGVAGIAKTRPELLKPTGTGGAGVRSTNAGGNGGNKQMTRADFEAMSPTARVEAAKAGVQLV